MKYHNVPVPESHLPAVYRLLAGPPPEQDEIGFEVPESGLWTISDLRKLSGTLKPIGHAIVTEVARASIESRSIEPTSLLMELRPAAGGPLTEEQLRGHLSALSRKCREFRGSPEWPMVVPGKGRPGYWMPVELARIWIDKCTD